MPWPSAEAVALHFIEAAIKQLRQIGGENARIDALKLRLQQLQRASIAAMPVFEVSRDITSIVKAAKALVADKPPMQALVALAFFRTSPGGR